VVSVRDFKKQIKLMKLILQQKSINRIIAAFDEDLNGEIFKDHYLAALDAYDCRGEAGASGND